MPVATRSQAQQSVRRGRREILRLPCEIRNTIYQYVLAPAGAGARNPRGNLFPGDALPLDAHDTLRTWDEVPAYMGLLQTCKQVHCEMASLLYNTIEMDLHEDRGPERALLGLGLQNLRLIKHITIQFRQNIRGAGRHQGQEIDTMGPWRAAAILRLLWRAGATLYTVTLKAPWHHMDCTASTAVPHRGCMSLQPLLRDPAIFSNIQTVIFPEFLALCPPRQPLGSRYFQTVRNRPLTEAQKGEITKRMGFQAERATSSARFQRSVGFLPKGFFIVVNPEDPFGSNDAMQHICEGEWDDLVYEHLAQLKSYGIRKYRARYF